MEKTCAVAVQTVPFASEVVTVRVAQPQIADVARMAIVIFRMVSPLAIIYDSGDNIARGTCPCVVDGPLYLLILRPSEEFPPLI